MPDNMHNNANFGKPVPRLEGPLRKATGGKSRRAPRRRICSDEVNAETQSGGCLSTSGIASEANIDPPLATDRPGAE